MSIQTTPSESAAPRTPSGQGGHFLEVTDLQVHFDTDDGLVRSVDGLSFHLDRGQTLGIVGESGSGKSVTSMAVMGLHTAKNARLAGSIQLDGRELTPGSTVVIDRRESPGEDEPPVEIRLVEGEPVPAAVGAPDEPADEGDLDDAATDS